MHFPHAVKEPAPGTLADREGHRITSNLIEPLNVSTPNFFIYYMQTPHEKLQSFGIMAKLSLKIRMSNNSECRGYLPEYFVNLKEEL